MCLHKTITMECVVGMCRADVILEIAAGEMMRWTWNIRWEKVFYVWTITSQWWSFNLILNWEALRSNKSSTDRTSTIRYMCGNYEQSQLRITVAGNDSYSHWWVDWGVKQTYTSISKRMETEREFYINVWKIVVVEMLTLWLRLRFI